MQQKNKISEKTQNIETFKSIMALIILGLMILIVFLMYTENLPFIPKETKPAKNFISEEEKELTAFICAIENVKSKLKSPTTAKFPSITYSEVSNINGIYYVKSYVDSQNSFGAILRQNFICEVYKPNTNTAFCESTKCAFE